MFIALFLVIPVGIFLLEALPNDGAVASHQPGSGGFSAASLVKSAATLDASTSIYQQSGPGSGGYQGGGFGGSSANAGASTQTFQQIGLGGF